MEINDLINLIGNVGFPVAVSSYLLIRLEKELHSLSNSIVRLSTLISTKTGSPLDLSSNQTENI